MKWFVAVLLLVCVPDFSWADSPGDFNQDGKVDFTDFILFAGRFGSVQGDASFDKRYDLNGNGKVEIGDYILFVEAFGPTSADKKALTADELEKEAISYQIKGNDQKAIEKYDETLKVSQDTLQMARVLKQLGELYVETDDVAKAVEQFTRGFKEFGDVEDLRVRAHVMWCAWEIGKIHHDKGDLKKATLYFAFSKKFLPTPP